MNQETNRIIQNALEAPPNYSEEFAVWVEEVAAAIAARLGVNVEHNSDMNYSVAHQIVIKYDDDGHPAQPDKGYRYRLIVLLSSRGKFYTIVVYRRTDVGCDYREYGLPSAGTYHLRFDYREQEGIQSSLESIRGVLQNVDVHEVDPDYLNEYVPGKVTEMDGVPATLFQVLFSELV